jgi:hypothetical protein
MAQDLTVNIKTTSDVPQAMDKAKQATVSFAKQTEDIQKKFSMAFKDVFLSFLGPMALVGIAINYIGKLIDENRKKQEDANQAAIDGTNALMSAEDKYWANKRNKEVKSVKETEQANTTREAVTKQFMIFDRERAFDLMSKEQQTAFMGGTSMNDIAKDPEYQKKVQATIAQDIKNDPEVAAEAAAKAAAEKAKADAKDLAELKQFAGKSKPGEIQGYGNVIGVGSNIAIEMAQMQIDELKRHTELLQMIATKESIAAVDFSKGDKSVAAPSRAKLLSGK